MSWLTGVIGRVLNIIRTVTLVCPTQHGQNGGNNNIVEQPQPVSKELKPKCSNVKAAILAQSPKVETLSVPIRTKKSSTTGTQRATPVRQQSATKPKRLVAQSTKVAKSSKQEPLQATKSVRGKQQATPVSKTPQHAKQAPKRKP